MSYYRDQLEEWLGQLDIRVDYVLDIGGGANPVEKRLGEWEVRYYRILDNNLEGEFCPYYEADLSNSWMGRGIEPADAVFCLEVFEYVFDPVTAIENIASVTKPGGVAYITFPFVYPWHEPKGRDCLRYTRAGVETLLKIAGFKKWEIDARVDRSGKLEEFFREDGMHPAKGEAHNVTGWMVKAWK